MHATTFCSCAAHSDLNSCCYITESDACCHVLQFITILPHKVVTCMQLCSYVQLLATITQLSLSVLLLLTARKRKSVHRAQHCELAGWNATTSVQLSLKSLHSCMGRGASETRSNPAVPGHRSSPQPSSTCIVRLAFYSQPTTPLPYICCHFPSGHITRQMHINEPLSDNQLKSCATKSTCQEHCRMHATRKSCECTYPHEDSPIQ